MRVGNWLKKKIGIKHKTRHGTTCSVRLVEKMLLTAYYRQNT